MFAGYKMSETAAGIMGDSYRGSNLTPGAKSMFRNRRHVCLKKATQQPSGTRAAESTVTPSFPRPS